MNHELPDIQAGLEKAEEPEIKLPISTGASKKQEFQKNIYFCFIDHSKAFDCVDHSKLWKILKEMEIPDHLSCLLKNLYAGQEAIVRHVDLLAAQGTRNNGLLQVVRTVSVGKE